MKKAHEKRKWFLLDNVIQTLNIYLLLQKKGSSWSTAGITQQHEPPRAPPRHGLWLGQEAAGQGGAEPGCNTQLWFQQLQLALSTQHKNSALGHGPPFTHTDERRLDSHPLHPHQCFSPCYIQHQCPWKGSMDVCPTSPWDLVRSPSQSGTSFLRYRSTNKLPLWPKMRPFWPSSTSPGCWRLCVWARSGCQEKRLGDEDGWLQAPSATEYGCWDLYSPGSMALPASRVAARPFSLLWKSLGLHWCNCLKRGSKIKIKKWYRIKIMPSPQKEVGKTGKKSRICSLAQLQVDL